MASNALTVVDDTTREMAVKIKSVLGFSGSDADLALFSTVSQRLGLDPFARQVYAVFRGGKMTIQTGIDGYRVIGFRAGLDAIGEPEFGPMKNGHPEWAKVSVWRKGSDRATVGVAYWDEYAQGGGMWTKMPRTMLAKCAEAQALRRAFPEALSGVYTEEEMSQADNADAQVKAIAERSPEPRKVEAIVVGPVKALPANDEPDGERDAMITEIASLMAILGRDDAEIAAAKGKAEGMTLDKLRTGVETLRSRVAAQTEAEDDAYDEAA